MYIPEIIYQHLVWYLFSYEKIASVKFTLLCISFDYPAY